MSAIHDTAAYRVPVREVRFGTGLESFFDRHSRAHHRRVVAAWLFGHVEDFPPGQHTGGADHVGLAIRPATQGEQLHQLARIVFVWRVDRGTVTVEENQHGGGRADLDDELAGTAQRVC